MSVMRVWAAECFRCKFPAAGVVVESGEAGGTMREQCSAATSGFRRRCRLWSDWSNEVGGSALRGKREGNFGILAGGGRTSTIHHTTPALNKLNEPRRDTVNPPLQTSPCGSNRACRAPAIDLLTPANPSRTYVLVTGATGFIGAHVVDQLLSKGIKVRGATRSLAKGEAMIRARPQYAGQLDFVQIGDFDDIAGDDSKQAAMFEEAVKGVNGIIHTASVRLLAS